MPRNKQSKTVNLPMAPGERLEPFKPNKLQRNYAKRMRWLRLAWPRLRLWRQHQRQAEVIDSVYGVRLQAHWPDHTFQSCANGKYGDVLAKQLAGHTAPFMFLDIGANQGLFSLLAAQNPTCQRAVALEPVQATFDILQSNIKINDAAGTITAIHAAVSERDGQAEIQQRSGHSGVATLRPTHDASSWDSETIRTMSADTLAAAVPGDCALTAKVDVEGHEQIVLEALLGSDIGPRLTWVFVEIDEDWTDPVQAINLLHAHGFKDFRRYGGGGHYDVLASRLAVS